MCKELAGAEISPCGLYRYRLWRHWGIGPHVLWIMLNPSTADGRVDDPTIRRCRSFTKAWGCDGFEVVNLYALRATAPRQLREHLNPQGSSNGVVIQSALRKPDARHKVAAWGAASALKRGQLVTPVQTLLRLAGGGLECLGTTKGGHPRHPLYVSTAKQLEPWPPPPTTRTV